MCLAIFEVLVQSEFGLWLYGCELVVGLGLGGTFMVQFAAGVVGRWVVYVYGLLEWTLT